MARAPDQLLSSVVSITQIPFLWIALILLAGSGGLWSYFGGYEKVTTPTGTTTRVTWGWEDYLGVALLLCVGYAMYKGVDPITLIELIVGRGKHPS
jgi:hypothetical protein